MLSTEQIVIRLLVSALLGSAVGLERQRRDWAAGLRTHMLVCIGATLAMIVSAFGFSDILGTPNVTLDPSRIAAQVVSGIGFLGAGTILFLRHEVIRGLTTAAGLWTVACIGLAVGGGLYTAAVAATGLALIILAVIKPLERKLFRQHHQRVIRIVIQQHHASLRDIQSLIEKNDLDLAQIIIQRGEMPEEENVQLILGHNADSRNMVRLIDMLREMNGIREVNYGMEE